MKNILSLLIAVLLIGTAVSCKKEGCTDEAANNYDAEAKKDNGACTYDPVIATLTTTAVSSIGVSSATCGGSISNKGSEDVTVVGLCWSTSQNPTVADEKTANFYNNNTFTSNMGGLTENTTYYVRAYATSDAGTAYGDEKTFTTLQIGLATLTTTSPVLITTSSITTGGNISDNGNGSILERGICWGTTTNPTIGGSHTAEGGTDLGSFSLNISNLQSETTYYIRSYATNSAGTAYGQEIIYNNPHVSFIGEFYEGGIVFYMDNSGEHGLVCSMDDLSSSAPWGCEVVTGVTAGDYFDGNLNTSTIVSLCSTPGIAAVLCSNLDENGYDDWYLPTTNECSAMYFNITDLNTSLTTNGGSIITLGNYWISVEENANNAYRIDFSDGFSTYQSKAFTNYVRAVRSF